MRFLLAVLFALAPGGLFTERLLLDGIDGVVFGWLSEDETEYAPRYTALGFVSVQPGISRAAVHGLLGEPLESWTVQPADSDSPDQAERWSRSPRAGSYYLRIVYYRDSRVVSKLSELYFD